MTKRLLSMLLAAVLLMGILTACGDDKKVEKKPTTTAKKSTSTTSAFPVYYVTANKLNVRREPDAASERLGELFYGEAVEVLEHIDGWCRISFDGAPAYVSAQYLSQQQPPTKAPTTTTTLPANTVLYVTANKLNVRREPDATGDLLGQLLYGDTVQLVGTVDGWYEIQYKGSTAYISADYASVTPPSGVTAVPTTTAPTKAPTGKYPDATIPPLQGGLTETERTELYEGLQDIIDKQGKNYQKIYTYINKNKTYRSMAEGDSIEQMAYYMLTHKSASCYYFAAFTYLLMQKAGYEVSFVRGLGWQNGTEHCWIMFKETDGWYFMDSLYVRSAKLTAKQCKEIGYKWNPDIHPEAK